MFCLDLRKKNTLKSGYHIYLSQAKSGQETLTLVHIYIYIFTAHRVL